MSRKPPHIRPLSAQEPQAPDTANLYAIFDEPLDPGEYRYWRSPVYVSPFLNTFPIPCCAVIIRQGSSDMTELYLYAQASVRAHGDVFTAIQAFCWLAIPDDRYDMMWTRDRQAEALKRDAFSRQTKGGVAIPNGLHMPPPFTPNGH